MVDLVNVEEIFDWKTLADQFHVSGSKSADDLFTFNCIFDFVSPISVFNMDRINININDYIQWIRHASPYKAYILLNEGLKKNTLDSISFIL